MLGIGAVKVHLSHGEEAVKAHRFYRGGSPSLYYWASLSTGFAGFDTIGCLLLGLSRTILLLLSHHLGANACCRQGSLCPRTRHLCRAGRSAAQPELRSRREL